ncbi:hypothetical protein I4U23_011072 [Adineta vaga]|nr:hypothetical protein I4U23_011072 [Adineta vaga]
MEKRTSWRQQIRVMTGSLWGLLTKLNMFKSSHRQEPSDIKEQRWTTRIFIICLVIGFIILTFYTMLSVQTKLIEIGGYFLLKVIAVQCQPASCSYKILGRNSLVETITIIIGLVGGLSVSLRITVPFVMMTCFAIIHRRTRQGAATPPNVENAAANAFTLHGTIFSHFQVLRSLCNLAKDAINFKSTLSDHYLNNLQLIRGMMQSNAFVSLYSTNWYPVLNNWSNWNYFSTIYMKPQHYGNCNCLTSSACNQPSVPFIQGYLVGCTPLEAVLHSSIECMYEQACIDRLTMYLNLSSSTPTPLNQSETRFLSNDTVDSIVQQMFIETCSSNVSYNQFFQQCRPLSCSVTLIKRNSLTVVITALLSLYGGLTTFLKLVVPVLIFSLHNIPPSTNEDKLRRECYITRIYIMILISSIMIIIISTITTGQTAYFRIKSPSLNDFISLNHFKRTISSSFQITLNLIKTNFEINQFITPINSRFSYSIRGAVDLALGIVEYSQQDTFHCLSLQNRNVSQCKCHATSPDVCYRHRSIFENDTSNPIPGMFQTWFPLQSLLMSTLEYLYNKTCLDQIQQLIISSKNLTLLKSFTSSNIDTLANNLFIQSRNNQSLFESYFNQCHPLTCQYTVYTRLNFIYIITKILGLIEGINIILCLFLPFLVIFFLKLINIIRQIKRTGIRQATVFQRRQLINHIHSIFKSTKQYLIELNLFPTIPSSQDPIILERNRHTTRIYLILLTTGLIILTLYGLLRQDTNIIIIKSPSISKYHELYSRYPLTLKCPCSNTAIKYKTILTQIQPRYHEICSSIFVSSQWQESIDTGVYQFQSDFSNHIDYRKLIRIQFQVLAQLCTLSQTTINASLTRFGQNNFITSVLISSAEFHFRIETILEQYKISISQQFMETIKLIPLTNYGNQLATGFLSNWIFTAIHFVHEYNVSLYNGQTILVFTRPRTYDENACSCRIQTICSTLSYIVDFISVVFFFDSLLQSTLTCLYSPSCLSTIQANIYQIKPNKANILTYSSLSPPNTTIETLLNQLFVSQWLQNTSFDHYFNECAPQSCQYSYLIQYNIIYVITMLIAVFGGLTKGLHFIVYCLELIFRKLITNRKKTNSIKPCPDIEQSVDSIISISQADTIPIRNSMKFVRQRKYINRTILICLILFAIGALITIFVMLLKNQKKEEEEIIPTSTQTTFITSNSTDTITEISNTCYMTLKHEFKTYPIGVVTLEGTNEIVIFFGIATSNLFNLSSYIFPFYNYSKIPNAIEVADMNFDGFMDLVISSPEKNSSYQDKLNIFVNNGDGYQFDLAFAYIIRDYNNILGIAIKGINEGKIGFHVCNGNSFVQEFISYKDNDLIIYTHNTQHYLYGHPTMIIKGNFNNDSLDDIAVLTCNGTLTVYLALSNQVFDTNYLSFKMNTSNNYSQCFHSLRIVDLNQDAKDDIVFIDTEMNQIRVLLGSPCAE